jgi:hypothetical protein
MSPALHKVAGTLEWCGAAMVVALSFPIIALALFLLRAVVVAVFALALVAGLVLFCAHSPFRAWLAELVRGPRHVHS